MLMIVLPLNQLSVRSHPGNPELDAIQVSRRCASHAVKIATRPAIVR
jgi:hypothetical protein